MKFNKWTMGLAAVGVVSLASAARADEKLSQVQTALSNTTLSGYVDTAAQWNLGSQNGGPTTPSFGNADGFTLNAIDIALDHPEDESPWAAGYHVEMEAGPDAIPVGTGGGVAVRQAYLALRTPVGNSGIDWHIGVWDTIIGYESSSDPSNPNYTRSYGYGIEPTTHTGILGTYKINDQFTVQAGVANGSNIGGGAAGFNGVASQESQKAYMGAIAFTAPDSWGWAKGTTINAGIINADDSTGASLAPAPGGTLANFAGTTSFYAGATVPTPWTALKVGVAFDYIDLHNAQHLSPGGVIGGTGSDDSLSVIGFYANYQYNDKLSFNGRFEHEDINITNPGPGGAPTPGLDEFTLTTQYALWANVLSRVEFRWDHSEDHAAFDASNYGAGPSAGGPIHNNAYMVALNLIYQF